MHQCPHDYVPQTKLFGYEEALAFSVKNIHTILGRATNILV